MVSSWHISEIKILARPWAIPGTKGLEHRIGGIEKEDVTGNVNYDPDNHHHMVKTRAKKVESIANEFEPTEIFGKKSGDLLILSWGNHGCLPISYRGTSRRKV